MNIVSLLPHQIILRLPDGTDHVVQPSGTVCRCRPGQATVGDEGLPVPVARTGRHGPVEGLPPPAEGTVYLVSRLVLDHPDVASRRDVLAPGTGPDDDPVRIGGQIVAVRRLVGRA